MKKTLFIILGFCLMIWSSIGLAQETDVLSLAQDGPYIVGVHLTELVDSRRADRELPLAIWYPATETGESNNLGRRDADGDFSNAPYPLIIYSHWMTSNYVRDVDLLAHLASQGFVVVSIEHGCDGVPMCNIDRPLDILFVIDALGETNEDTLIGMIDYDNVGLMGISFGGYAALVAAGGQIDPVYYVDWAESQSLDTFSGRVASGIVSRWDEMETYADEVGIIDREDRWVFPTNDRIKVVLPIVPAMGWMFGEDGLATVTAPTLMLAATHDQFLSYDQYSIPLYSQIDASDRYLISFVGYNHHIESRPSGKTYIKQFSTALFYYYLKDEVSFADYLTADYAEQFEDLAWGVYEEE